MISTATGAPTATSGNYNNPILPGFNPDPSITRIPSPIAVPNTPHAEPSNLKNSYFLTTSSFDFFPGLPLYHSTDLINWKLISHILSRPSQLSIRSVDVGGGVWAPTLRYRSAGQLGRLNGKGGVFYCVGSCFERYRPQEDDRGWPRGFLVTCEEEDIWCSDGRGWSEVMWFDTVGFDQDVGQFTFGHFRCELFD
jgi:beta-xylosidase